MLNFTFLKEEQIWGDDALDVMKRYGTKVTETVLTVLLGGWVSDEGKGGYTISWSASSDGRGRERCVGFNGDKDYSDTDVRRISARPALPPSEASKISPSKARAGVNGVQIVEYGEYPQTVAGDETREKLERLHFIVIKYQILIY